MRKSHVPQSSLFQECLARLELIPQSDIEAIIRLDIGSKRSFDLNESECILVEVIRAPCRDFSPGIFHADAAPVFNPVVQTVMRLVSGGEFPQTVQFDEGTPLFPFPSKCHADPSDHAVSPFDPDVQVVVCPVFHSVNMTQGQLKLGVQIPFLLFVHMEFAAVFRTGLPCIRVVASFGDVAELVTDGGEVIVHVGALDDKVKIAAVFIFSGSVERQAAKPVVCRTAVGKLAVAFCVRECATPGPFAVIFLIEVVKAELDTGIVIAEITALFVIAVSAMQYSDPSTFQIGTVADFAHTLVECLVFLPPQEIIRHANRIYRIHRGCTLVNRFNTQFAFPCVKGFCIVCKGGYGNFIAIFVYQFSIRIY